jgi:aspartyl-tRNA(Asn)/glutamyl-tRNA(Gln) amidotransferase subunit B
MATEPDRYVDYDEAVEKFDPVFGVEVHVELSTKTKLFDAAPNAFGAEPNTLVTPVSLGLPGALPVLNKKAVEYAVKIGLALNCKIAKKATFARKNYFYPDLTKNYQTSQADEPICGEGYLDITLDDGKTFRVEIERAHLEEDAGKNTHVGGSDGRIFGADYSMVDYNRAGVPLVEIVSKPVWGAGARTPEVISKYVRALRDIFRTLGVSEAKMERGNVRADINISLSPKGSGKLGIRSETKNVNSFRSIEKAAYYEITRHASILIEGKPVTQETRHWQEVSSSTTSGREKSDAEDYRYFPEPDLVPVVVGDDFIESVRRSMPELPRARRARLQKEWGYSDIEMRDAINANALDLIDASVKAGVKPESAKKWWLGELSRHAKEAGSALDSLGITPKDIFDIENLISAGKINDKIARTVITSILGGEGTADSIVEAKGLAIVSDDSELLDAVRTALADDEEVLAKLKAGNMAPIGVIIGKVMKQTQGKADAKRVRELILEEIRG